jgi:hypothetical protein
MATAEDHLHPTAWAVFRALRAGVRISRNKHFALFQDARIRKALRLHRYLASVAADVTAHPDELVAEPVDDAHWQLRIEVPTLHGRRVAHLTDWELTLLAEISPTVADLLRRRAGIIAP